MFRLRFLHGSAARTHLSASLSHLLQEHLIPSQLVFFEYDLRMILKILPGGRHPKSNKCSLVAIGLTYVQHDKDYDYASRKPLVLQLNPVPGLLNAILDIDINLEKK